MTAIRKNKLDIVNGPVLGVLFSVSVPIMLNNVITSLYNLADGLWVAQLSIVDFTATSFIWPPHFFFVSLGIGLAMAGTSIISQLLGAGKIERAESYAAHIFYFCLFIGIVFGTLGVVLAPAIIGGMGATGLLADRSVTYFSIIMVGFIFEMIYLSLYSILAAQGQTRIMTTISLVIALVNVVLDPIFIFAKVPLIGTNGLNMGIAGAAWATVISQVLRVFLAVLAVMSRHNEVRVHLRGIKLTKRQFSEIAKAGFPTALGQGSAALGFTLMNSVVVSYGQATLSAYSAVNRVSGFLMQPANGVGSALTAIIGQNMGAQKIDRVKKFNRAAFQSITVITVASAILLILLRNPLLKLFLGQAGDDADLVWKMALEYVFYIAAMTPAMGYFNAFSGIFIGAGYHRYSAYLSILRLWGLRLPILLLFQRFTNLDATGIWLAMLFSNVLLIPAGLWLYLRGKWLREPRIDH
ncbi:MAG TPA: MATE family efflux transporter [Clostridiaceae bacterium]|nr:MATE family efflux transporter [Clostridiaceae bacterium]